MSKAKTRSQYVYLKVRKSTNFYEPSIFRIYGPAAVIDDIRSAGFDNDSVTCTCTSLGSSMELELSVERGVHLPFIKASLLEEVSKHRFTLLEQKRGGDSLTFTREVPLSKFQLY